MNRQHESWLGQLSFSVTPILNYIHRGVPDYTIHGTDHCREIESLARDILKKCNSKTRRCNTSSYEEYLVLASAWLHDLGNILGRDNHNKTSCDIIDQLGTKYIWGLAPNAVELVKWVCFAHAVNVPIEKVEETVNVEGKVKLRFLAALFRLLDASDMANRRAPLPVYELIKEKLDEETQKHWTSHQAILDISYPEDSESIVITVIDKDKAQFAVDIFNQKFESVRNTLISYEFPWRKFDIVQIEKVPTE